MENSHNPLIYHDKLFGITEDVEYEQVKYCSKCERRTKHIIVDDGKHEKRKCKKCGHWES